jgi:hypothetical protein
MEAGGDGSAVGFAILLSVARLVLVVDTSSMNVSISTTHRCSAGPYDAPP